MGAKMDRDLLSRIAAAAYDEHVLQHSNCLSSLSRLPESNKRFVIRDSSRFVMRIDSFKKSAFRFTSCYAVFALNK